MSFRKSLIRLQFKIDHTSFHNRIALLCTLLFMIIVPWYFLIYTPQTKEAAQVQQQIDELKAQTDRLRNKYDAILAHAKSHDMDALITQYHRLKKQTQSLDQKLIHYRHSYIEDNELATLLYSILKDMKNVSIENFSTLASIAPVSVPSKSGTKTGTPAPAPEPSKAPIEIVPETTRYSLSLKGDYFSIMRFLQRLEQLKWQLFWDNFNYHVKSYPQAIATVEFHTLKTSDVLPVPAQGVPK